MKLKEFIKKYFSGDSKKIIKNMIILVLVGVLLILIADIGASLVGDKKKLSKNTLEVNSNVANAILPTQYEEKVKRDLTETLSMISGVGRVSVMIYFQGGSETIPAVNVNKTDKKTEEKDNQGGTRTTTEENNSSSIVIIDKSSGNEPLIIKQTNPEIGGVMIVAEGAEKPEIKEKIHNAVRTVLNLPGNKVSVMQMKK